MESLERKTLHSFLSNNVAGISKQNNSTSEITMRLWLGMCDLLACRELPTTVYFFDVIWYLFNQKKMLLYLCEKRRRSILREHKHDVICDWWPPVICVLHKWQNCVFMQCNWAERPCGVISVCLVIVLWTPTALPAENPGPLHHWKATPLQPQGTAQEPRALYAGLAYTVFGENTSMRNKVMCGSHKGQSGISFR